MSLELPRHPLECCDLRKGFASVRCPDCRHDRMRVDRKKREQQKPGTKIRKSGFRLKLQEQKVYKKNMKDL